LPAGCKPAAAPAWPSAGLAARTGGAFSVHAVDDLQIAVSRPPSPVISSVASNEGSVVLPNAGIVVKIANGIA